MQRPARLPVSFPHTFVDFLVLCNNLVLKKKYVWGAVSGGGGKD